jgi:hypothetical protein
MSVTPICRTRGNNQDAEQIVAADRAGITAFGGATALRPARRLNWGDYEAVWESSRFGAFFLVFSLPVTERG